MMWELPNYTKTPPNMKVSPKAEELFHPNKVSKMTISRKIWMVDGRKRPFLQFRRSEEKGKQFENTMSVSAVLYEKTQVSTS